ncbi:aminotransferase [Mangrovicella endophytica]|uniref:aminotransferase n=1 Tax=Mangrovicella endophytica TaxID=2066697 RepID=UPI000C9E590A|nr:aminotransferase [Mangrovicella endophytica]
MPSANPLLTAMAAPPVALAARWRAAYDGRNGPLVDLSQAVPGHAPAPELLARFAAEGATAAAARYGLILGDPALRDAYGAEVARLYGAGITAANVAITAGCNQAFFAAIIAVARAGDAVVLPTPWYFNHKMTLDMLGIEARPLPLSAETGFIPSADALEQVLDDRVKAVVLVTPNNPTGAIYPPETIAAIHALCRRRDLWLILDETYRDFLPAGNPRPHALFADGGWGENVVSLYSFSKSYAIPGHRLGAMLAGPSMLPQIEKVVDSMQICAPRPAQATIAPAIESLAEWRAGMAGEIAERAEVFREVMATLPDWRLEQIGAYFAFIRHPYEGRDARSVAEHLARDLGIITLPGSFFGEGQEQHLRIAFANVDVAAIGRFGERLAADDWPAAG